MKSIPLSILVALVFIYSLCAHSEGGKISMNFESAALKDVLKAFSRQTGLNFIASQGIENKNITIYLNNVSTEDALNSILIANGFTYEKQRGDVYVVKPSGIKEIMTITKVFQLSYLQVYDMSSQGIGEETSFSLAGTSSQMSGSGSASGGLTASSSALEGESLSDSTGSAVSSGFGQNKNIVSVVGKLLSLHGNVVADKRSNSLIVTDIPERVQAIARVIEELDVEPRQLMIQAEIIETTTDAVKRVGVQYGSSTSTATFTYGDLVAGTTFPFTNNFVKELFGGTLLDEPPTGSPTNFTFGTLTASDTQIVLQLFAEDEDTKFLSKPRIMTINNEPAIIKVSADTAIGVESTSVTETSEVIETAERFETGIILKVTPSVNAEGDIFMYVEPTIARAETSTFFSTRFMDPQIRSATSTVMVKDGDTVIIAGLIKTDNYKTIRRIPILGDIPILGEPFKSRYKKVEDTEIIIFITPRIVDRKKSKTVSTEVLPLSDSPDISQVSPETAERDYLIDRVLERYSTE